MKKQRYRAFFLGAWVEPLLEKEYNVVYTIMVVLCVILTILRYTM
jgi:hypothetical protein